MASLEAWIPPGVLREVCARLSLSQRAESAFKSSIIAYRKICQYGGFCWNFSVCERKAWGTLVTVYIKGEGGALTVVKFL